MKTARGRIRAESFADHYTQARLFYRSQTAFEQAHIASALVFELSKVERSAIREKMVGHLRHIDDDLAARVGGGLGFEKIPAPAATSTPPRDAKLSPALQIIGKMKNTLDGRAVGIALSDGSTPTIAGQLAGTPSVLFDAVAIVLSKASASALTKEAAAVDFLRDAFGHLKAIALDAGGRSLLESAGIQPDDAVVEARDVKRFIAAGKTRAWKREPSVRTLA